MAQRSPSFDGTIDWNEYWAEIDDPTAVREDDANGSREHLIDPVIEFCNWAGPPDRYADVGCGGGVLLEAVTERFSDTTGWGYDAAPSVVAANRRRTTGEGIHYEQEQLPGFDPAQSFDLVTCVFTLCYVREVQAALQALYEAVAPGGNLVITYHNRDASSLFRRFAEAPHAHFDETSTWDPDRFPSRFELVIEGESTLSYRRIQDVLGAWPQSVWSVTETVEPYAAARFNPLVYVPKPATG
ncbi:MAG: class I SAM-dependent methyltransferase [Halobacteriaceae archaeon]